MANVTVELTTNQIIGAKNHFSEPDNAKALVLFNAWIASHANQWYMDSLKADIDAITTELYNDPSKIAPTLLAVKK